MAKPTVAWIPLIFGGLSTAAMLAGGAMAYGSLQTKVASLERDIEDHDKEYDRTKSILHQRISTAQSEISALKTSALMRVTDVEVKITKLDSKIDNYSAAAQAARSEAQATMNSILQRLQQGLNR